LLRLVRAVAVRAGAVKDVIVGRDIATAQAPKL
jgi:hypothetical protein